MPTHRFYCQTNMTLLSFLVILHCFIDHDDTQTDTTVIVGVALGVFSFVAVVFAILVTVVLKRKTSKKGKRKYLPV